MLVKVWSHASTTATQSLMGTFLDPLAVYQPTAFISQHATVHPAGHRWALSYPVQSQMTTRRSVRHLTLQDAGDVTQQVIKKLGDSLVTWVKSEGGFR